MGAIRSEFDPTRGHHIPKLHPHALDGSRPTNWQDDVFWSASATGAACGQWFGESSNSLGEGWF